MVLPDHCAVEIETLAKQLSSDPSVLKHPHRSDPTFIFCANLEDANRLRTQLTDDPQRPIDIYPVIVLRDGWITVYNTGLEREMRKINGILLPILKKADCKIVSEYADDITHKYQDRLDKLFCH